MNRLSTYQILYLLDKYIKEDLQKGKMPRASYLFSKLIHVVPGLSLLKTMTFKDREKINKSQIEDAFKAIDSDLEILYTALFEEQKQLSSLKAQIETISIKFNRSILELEALIGGMDKSYNAVEVISPYNKVLYDMENSTAEIDFYAGQILLPKTSRLSNRMTFPHLYSMQFPENIIISADVKYNSTRKDAPFYRPFFGEGYWKHDIVTKTPQKEIKVSFDIDLKESVFINGISIKPLTTMTIELQKTTDVTDVNFVRFSNTVPLRSSGTVLDFRFPSTLCRKLRVICTIPPTDEKTNLHVIAIEDFGIYNTGYAASAKLYTNDLMIPANTRSVRITADATIPDGTTLTPYISIDDGFETKTAFDTEMPLSGKSIYSGTAYFTGNLSDFQTERLYATKYGVSFYYIPIEDFSFSNIEEVQRGVSGLKVRRYTEKQDEATVNIFNMRVSDVNSIIRLYRIVTEDKNREVLSNPGDDDNYPSSEYPYYISTSQVLYTNAVSTIISALDSNTADNTAMLETSNSTIVTLRNSQGVLLNAETSYRNKIRAVSGNRIYLSDYLDKDPTADAQNASIKYDLVYKTPITSGIFRNSVVVSLNNEPLVEGTDFIIDQENAQIRFNKLFNTGIYSISFKRIKPSIAITEYSCFLTLDNDIQVTLKTPPSISYEDEVYLDNIRISSNISTLPVLNRGVHFLTIRTKNVDPLSVLKEILSLRNKEDKLVFFEVFSSFVSHAAALIKTSLDYLLYNTYRKDTDIYSVYDNKLIIPFTPYYSETEDCVLTVISTNLSDLTAAKANCERFKIIYNNNVETKNKLKLMIKFDRSDVTNGDVTPVLKELRVYFK